jgi:hypothetical protein
MNNNIHIDTEIEETMNDNIKMNREHNILEITKSSNALDNF